ncbi:YHS domain-containing (seleno)protein [Candidatus Raskinella chloraquaticus]|uniref:YHS domain-containing (seleno)protein n=1 Tax=Candidatus Raskinella chloraquaticus TaxID=1951219 RepID=UPI0036719909
MSLVKQSRRFVLAGLAMGLAAAALPSQAAEDVSFNTTYGLALRGFDPVGYFTENRAVKGLPTITTTYKGAIYEFASDANKATFLANPEKYVPQFGGFCAWATSQGYKADIDPHAFVVNDGKLYVNFSSFFRDKFHEDLKNNTAKAEANWAKVRTLTEIAR